MYEGFCDLRETTEQSPEIFRFDKENKLLKGRLEKICRLFDAVWDSALLGGITLVYIVIIAVFLQVHSSFFTLTPVYIYCSYCLIKILRAGAIYWKHALIPYYPFIIREADRLKVIVCGSSDMEYLLSGRQAEEEAAAIPNELLHGKPVNGFYILEYHRCRYIKESSRFYYFRADAKKRKNVTLKLPKIYHDHDRLKETV